MKGLTVRRILLLLVVTAAPAQLSAQAHGVSTPVCAADGGTDADHDGLSDECELELARTFAPRLVVRSGGCNWDSAHARLGGGYLYAVQRVKDVVRIAYLPAYFNDCGWSGAKCLLPWIDCAPHAGDSELIVVELEQDSSADWSVGGIFLSAHCFGRSGDDCRWYRGRDLRLFEWAEARPVVWVSEGRQANYPTWSSCDRGHHSIDTCDNHDLAYDFPVRADLNLGSRAAPAQPRGCVSGADVASSLVALDATECFWQGDVGFAGWQGRATGATSYERYLREVAGF